MASIMRMANLRVAARVSSSVTAPRMSAAQLGQILGVQTSTGNATQGRGGQQQQNKLGGSAFSTSSLGSAQLGSEVLAGGLAAPKRSTAVGGGVAGSLLEILGDEDDVDTLRLRRRSPRTASVGSEHPGPPRAAATSNIEPSSGDEGDEGELSGTPLTEFSGDLLPTVFRALQAAGVNSLFPVQRETLRRVLAGEDVVVRSRTGSGKTLGFAIPIVELLAREGPSGASDRGDGPRAIVLTPTRELAKQVEEEIARIAGRLGLRSLAVYGGAAFGPQAEALERGVDVVVGTPGRLIDMLERRCLSLSRCRIAVLDEADEMLRMGFKEDVERIYGAMPAQEERHNLMWSATVAPWVRTLARTYCNSPQFVDLVGDDASKLPASVSFVAYVCDDRGGPAARTAAFAAVVASACRSALEQGGSSGGAARRKVLVFTDRKEEARELASTSIPGVRLAALTGDLSQAQREKALADFKNGSLDVICATDVAARGLDIPAVDSVIQFRLPQGIESFVHRSGRTGRAGRPGTAAVLVSLRDLPGLTALERGLSFSFSLRPLPTAASAAAAGPAPSHADQKRRSREADAFARRLFSVPREAVQSLAVDSGLLAAVLARFPSPADALPRALALLAAGGDAAGGAGSALLTYHSAITGRSGVVTLGLSLDSDAVDEGLRGLLGAPPRGGWTRPTALSALSRVLAAGGADSRANVLDGAYFVPAVAAEGTAASLVFDLESPEFEALREGLEAHAAAGGSADGTSSARVSTLLAPLAALPAAVKAALVSRQGGALATYGEGMRGGRRGGGGRNSSPGGRGGGGGGARSYGAASRGGSPGNSWGDRASSWGSEQDRGSIRDGEGDRGRGERDRGSSRGGGRERERDGRGGGRSRDRRGSDAGSSFASRGQGSSRGDNFWDEF